MDLLTSGTGFLETNDLGGLREGPLDCLLSGDAGAPNGVTGLLERGLLGFLGSRGDINCLGFGLRNHQ